MTIKSEDTKSKTVSTPTDGGSGYNATPSDNNPPAEPSGNESETDDYGYASPNSEPVKKEEQAPQKVEEPVKKEEEKVETPASGYNEEPPKPADENKNEEPKKEEGDSQKDEKDLETQITEALGDAPEFLNKDKVKEFALNNKLNSEQVKSYLDLVKAENEDSIKAQENFVKQQRSEWHTQLKSDPSFGNNSQEQFDKNVDQVERLLEKFMPNTKKVLTERGSMLPPYTMRDLLSLSKALNPTTDFTNGEPPTPPEKEGSGNFLDDLYQ